MPREPTLAQPHDRQPIKEYNDLPISALLACPPSPRSLSLSVHSLINFQTNLFIVHRRLSAEVTGRIDPFPLPFDWLRFDFENGQELFIDCLPPLYLLREEEHNRSLPTLFISTLSQSFCTSSCLDLSQRGSWCRRGRFDLHVRVKVGLLIPTGSQISSFLSRMAHRLTLVYSGFRIRWYFPDPLRRNCLPGRLPKGRSQGK